MPAKAPAVIPIPGSSCPQTIRDSAAAADLQLSADELRRLDEVWLGAKNPDPRPRPDDDAFRAGPTDGWRSGYL
jgi:diketogulonate reductase-like aldo/keto reductase